MSSKIYNITFSINREYLLFMCVTLYSLLKNNQEYFFNIYVLHNNCLNNSEIQDICNKYPLNQYNNFKIHLIDVSHFEIINKFEVIGHWSKEVYFKLFAHLVLPHVDKILHLDTDVLIIDDIKEFLDINMDNNYFIGDKYIDKESICAGVLIINLLELRKEHVLEDLEKELLLNNRILEEDFFNKVYKDKIKSSPTNYIYTLPRKDEVLVGVTKIIHFTTIKPYVLQRFKIKDLSSKKINEYFSYLKDFIEEKYQYRFNLMKNYILYCGSITNSLERRVRYFWYRYILKRKEFYYKSNMWTEKIYKYSTIGKYISNVKK